MEIKKFNQLNENIDDVAVHGLKDKSGNQKIHKHPDRAEQNFNDYYHGARINGKSKYELSQAIFKMAERDDDFGILAQFCLQIERDSMAHDSEIESTIGADLNSVKTFSDFK
jgi:hypothetical protein